VSTTIGTTDSTQAEPARAAQAHFDTKVVVLLRDDLAMWQALNVAAFLVSGIVGAVDDIIGKPYEDADGTQYLAMCRQPITCLLYTSPSPRDLSTSRMPSSA